MVLLVLLLLMLLERVKHPVVRLMLLLRRVVVVLLLEGVELVLLLLLLHASSVHEVRLLVRGMVSMVDGGSGDGNTSRGVHHGGRVETRKHYALGLKRQRNMFL